MIAILDYGVGNLFSLASSFAYIGEEAVVTGDPAIIKAADRLILPGVGAFEDAAKKLRESGLDRVIFEEVANGKPLLGICLGMQLLFEKSFEYGEHAGLGLIKGSVKPIRSFRGGTVFPSRFDRQPPPLRWHRTRWLRSPTEYSLSRNRNVRNTRDRLPSNSETTHASPCQTKVRSNRCEAPSAPRE